MKTQKRYEELLHKAAEDLEAGNMLLNGQFLRDNGVTADEAVALANNVAALIRGFVRSDIEIQAMLLLLGSDTEEKIPSYIAFNIAFQERALRRMKSGEDAEESVFTAREK